MKKLLILLFLLSGYSYADIPTGRYKMQKIVCSNGTALKLGGKFIQYEMFLDVRDGEMDLTAKAQSAPWAPFKINCLQVNRGKFSYVGDSQYEGYLAMDVVKCNAKAWDAILKKQNFGVEEQGTFDYSINGEELVISNPNTITKYSCEKTGSYPIYYYKRL